MHAAPPNGSWTRRFSYDEASLIEPGKASNRLTQHRRSATAAQPERFGYDAHGNMTAMAHLAGMEWDFRDQLRRVDLGGGGTAYYVYDAAGERVRKVVEQQRREPRRGTDLPWPASRSSAAGTPPERSSLERESCT